MLALEGCFVAGPRPVSPAYGYPAYGYAAPAPAALVVHGDWDEHHVWHERDWWVNNRRDWVHVHHPEWIASRAHHEDYAHR
jgi:hypothetical protein